MIIVAFFEKIENQVLDNAKEREQIMEVNKVYKDVVHTEYWGHFRLQNSQYFYIN